MAVAGGQIGSWDCSEGRENCQIWARPLHDGSYAVVLFNAGIWSSKIVLIIQGNYTHSITVDFSLLQWENEQVNVRDLWLHQVDMRSYLNFIGFGSIYRFLFFRCCLSRSCYG